MTNEINELKRLEKLELSMRNMLFYEDDKPDYPVLGWQLAGIIAVGCFILWFIFGG